MRWLRVLEGGGLELLGGRGLEIGVGGILLVGGMEYNLLEVLRECMEEMGMGGGVSVSMDGGGGHYEVIFEFSGRGGHRVSYLWPRDFGLLLEALYEEWRVVEVEK